MTTPAEDNHIFFLLSLAFILPRGVRDLLRHSIIDIIDILSHIYNFLIQ